MSDKWHFIINPISGSGKGIQLWDIVRSKLNESGIDYSFDFSEYHGHSIILAENRIKEGIRNFIGVGGDGTLNEILNGILKNKSDNLNKIMIGLIPIGTGNDWVRGLGQKIDVDNLIQKLRVKEIFKHSIGITSFNRNENKRFFLNVAGLGLDGSVSEKLESLSNSKKSKIDYLLSALKALVSYDPALFESSIDSDAPQSEKLLFFTASIGKYFGGGISISPEANNNSGKLSFTRVGNASLFRVLPHLPKLFNGKVDQIDFVSKQFGTAASLLLNKEMAVQLDGEFIGRYSEIQFSVHPKRISILI